MGHPGHYVKVSYFIPWIMDVVEGKSFIYIGICSERQGNNYLNMFQNLTTKKHLSVGIFL